MLDSMAKRFVMSKGYTAYDNHGQKIAKLSIKRSTESINNISIREAMWWGYASNIGNYSLVDGVYLNIDREKYLVLRVKHDIESTETSIWLAKCNVKCKFSKIKSDGLDKNGRPLEKYWHTYDCMDGYEGVVTYRMRDIEAGRQNATKYTYVLPINNEVMLNHRLTIEDGCNYPNEHYTVSSIDKRALDGIMLIQATKDVR